MGVANEYLNLGRLIEGVGTADFGDLLASWLRSTVTFDLMTIVVYRADDAPIHIYDDFRQGAARDGMMKYISQTYILNAFFQRHQKGLQSGVYRIRDLAPDEYFESEIYRGYEVVINASEEVGYVTQGWPQELKEVDIAVSLEAATTAEIGLYRTADTEDFTDAQLDSLRMLLPVIEGASRRHWWLSGKRPAETSERGHSWTQVAFDTFAQDKLSAREREVVTLIMKGHSSESIASHLEISITTVKTHRKRAYEKLVISTQAELLSLFLKHAQSCMPQA